MRESITKPKNWKPNQIYLERKTALQWSKDHGFSYNAVLARVHQGFSANQIKKELTPQYLPSSVIIDLLATQAISALKDAKSTQDKIRIRALTFDTVANEELAEEAWDRATVCISGTKYIPLSEEIWKPISGHPGYYISNLARMAKYWPKQKLFVLQAVYRVKKIKKPGSRPLKPGMRKRTRSLMAAQIDGKQRSLALLVAETFLPHHDPEKTIVSRKNGKWNDCRAANLRWVRPADHAKKTGTKNKINKPLEQLDADGNVIATFESIAAAARELNVQAQGYICGVAHGTIQSEKYRFRFKDPKDIVYRRGMHDKRKS